MVHTGFFWILIAGLIYGVLHSALASLWLKKKAVQKFGPAGKKYYRLFFVAAASLTTVAYLALVVLLPDRMIYRIPFPWVVVTLAIELASTWGVVKCLWESGPLAFLGVDVLWRKTLTAPDEKLITNGLYARMRHPIYTFSFVLIWFSPLLTWNLLALFLGVTAYTLIGSVFEEQKLVQAFGQEYQEYQKTTPAFLPKLKR